MLYLGPLQHHSMYDRIIDAAIRYSTVVNYAGAVEIPFLPRHPALSSSSTSTAASQPTPSTLVLVRNVVPTLTSSKRCGLSLDGRC
jgi:hypothetical protein